jgi:hypothetical protein
MYIRPAKFNLPCADPLTPPTASQAVLRLAQGYKPFLQILLLPIGSGSLFPRIKRSGALAPTGKGAPAQKLKSGDLKKAPRNRYTLENFSLSSFLKNACAHSLISDNPKSGLVMLGLHKNVIFGCNLC